MCFIVILGSSSCVNNTDENIRISSSEDIIPRKITSLKAQKWVTKDTLAYIELERWVSLECDLCSMDSISQLFAKKYNYDKAYLNIFNCLIGNHCGKVGGMEDVNIDNIDKIRLDEALEHLTKAVNLGSVEAKEILQMYFSD